MIGHVKKTEQRINSKAERIQLNTSNVSNVIVFVTHILFVIMSYGDRRFRLQFPTKLDVYNGYPEREPRFGLVCADAYATYVTTGDIYIQWNVARVCNEFHNPVQCIFV